MPKRTVVKKKHSRKPVQKKQKHSMSQSQSQTVHVHLHKNTHSQKKQSHMHKKTTSTPVSATTAFVAPLPMYHPLNNNVPYSSFSSTYPINSFNYQAAPLVPQPIPHAVPHPAVTHPAVTQSPVTQPQSPVQPPSAPGTPHIGGMLHGTRGLFSASPISAINTPDSTGFRSPGTDGYRSVGSGAGSGGTFHSSPRTLSRSSTSDPSVHSTPGKITHTQSRTPSSHASVHSSPGIFSPTAGMSPQSQKELVRKLEAEASAMWPPYQHSSHSNSPRLTPENYFKSSPGSPLFKSDETDHRKDTPNYAGLSFAFSPEPLLTPSPKPSTVLHMLPQTQSGARAHSSPARQESSLSPHVLTQSQSQAPLVKTPSPIRTLTQAAAKDASRTSSPAHEAIVIPPRQVKFSTPPSSPVEKRTREPKLYLEDYTEEAMQNIIAAITPLRKKNGGISIEQVKIMLKKGVTLKQLEDFILNPARKRTYMERASRSAIDHTFSFTNEEKQAVVNSLTPSKVKAKIAAAEKKVTVAAPAPAPAKKAPSPAKKKVASVPVDAEAQAKKDKKKVPGISVSKVENKLTSGFSFDQLQDLLNNKDKRKDFLNK